MKNNKILKIILLKKLNFIPKVKFIIIHSEFETAKHNKLNLYQKLMNVLTHHKSKICMTYIKRN